MKGGKLQRHRALYSHRNINRQKSTRESNQQRKNVNTNDEEKSSDDSSEFFSVDENTSEVGNVIVDDSDPEGVENVHTAARKDTQQGWKLDILSGRLVQKKQVIEALTFAPNRFGNFLKKKKRKSHVSEKEENPGATIFRIRSKIVDSDEWKYSMGEMASCFVSEFLRWTFRKTFLEVCLVFYVLFLALNVLFAIFIFVAGQHSPRCISVSKVDFDDAGTDFIDAFQLSWTTFSNVGYGAVAPLVPSKLGDPRCIGMNVIMAIDAFIGVLFGAILGSMLVAKVSRVQSIAQVKFSDLMVLRFGDGIRKSHQWNRVHEYNKKKLPCPLLEFRVINELSSIHKGEILEAGVSVVGVTLGEVDELDRKYFRSFENDEENASYIPDQMRRPFFNARQIASNARGTLAQKVNKSIIGSGNDDHRHDFEEPDDDQSFKRSDIEHAKRNSCTSVSIEEGDTELVPRRHYTKLDMETDSHPFFKHVWTIGHRLNEDSPLLSSAARRMVLENDGFWPAELNDYEKILEHLKFAEIIVNFNGISGSSGNTVFAVKIYEFATVKVGYTFVSALTKTEDNRVLADMKRINDITEQIGGGAEPLQDQ